MKRMRIYAMREGQVDGLPAAAQRQHRCPFSRSLATRERSLLTMSTLPMFLASYTITTSKRTGEELDSYGESKYNENIIDHVNGSLVVFGANAASKLSIAEKSGHGFRF